MELGSKVYVCTLDTKQAYDTFWLDGIFCKLHQFGIQGKPWRLLKEAHVDMRSCVYLNGMQSKWFAVNQGVRQGGILSTLIYNLFIDGLLIELEESNLGTCILDNKIGNCTLADDLTLSCISPANLQNMLDIVNVYSCRWRYIINPLKSNIIVFGDR